ncbi:hypothetical protein [Paenibacillus dendritiformis]|uniref:hypothetical protein n=1 Tax=Paenibacillus dendritiformis TaxID=130049 RepID=UPI00387E0509
MRRSTFLSFSRNRLTVPAANFSRKIATRPEAKAWHNKQGNGFELVANELRLMREAAWSFGSMNRAE